MQLDEPHPARDECRHSGPPCAAPESLLRLGLSYPVLVLQATCIGKGVPILLPSVARHLRRNFLQSAQLLLVTKVEEEFADLRVERYAPCTRYRDHQTPYWQ